MNKTQQSSSLIRFISKIFQNKNEQNLLLYWYILDKCITLYYYVIIIIISTRTNYHWSIFVLVPHYTELEVSRVWHLDNQEKLESRQSTFCASGYNNNDIQIYFIFCIKAMSIFPSILIIRIQKLEQVKRKWYKQRHVSWGLYILNAENIVFFSILLFRNAVLCVMQ